MREEYSRFKLFLLSYSVLFFVNCGANRGTRQVAYMRKTNCKKSLLEKQFSCICLLTLFDVFVSSSDYRSVALK
jgi:hypothetical protein